MDLASRWVGLEVLSLNGEFKARSLALRRCFNLRVEKTKGVHELQCRVGEESGSFKILGH